MSDDAIALHFLRECWRDCRDVTQARTIEVLMWHCARRLIST